MDYEPIDVAGDAGIRARGKSLEDVFKNTILGMYSLITDLDKVERKKQIEFMKESDSLEGLLISVLNELIFRADAYNFIGSAVEITELSAKGEKKKIKLKVDGEEFDPHRHPGGLLLKAATYHGLKIEKKNGGWELEVIFDI